METPNSTIYLLGVRVDNITGPAALEKVRQFAMKPRNGSPARRVFFTNVHSIHIARRDPNLCQAINTADLVLPDGSGLKLAGRLFGTSIRENLNGTDFTPKLLRVAEHEKFTVYLLGADKEVNEACKKRLNEMFPALDITGSQHGHFSPKVELDIIDEINQKNPDILLVALGTPLQEQWISANAPRLCAGVCLGVGGLFDFLSGSKRRAPHWLRRLGLEWIYRFFQDPRSKWDRIFIEIPLFLLLVFSKRFIPRSLNSIFRH